MPKKSKSPTPAAHARFRDIHLRQQAETARRLQDRRRERHEDTAKRLAEGRRARGHVQLRWESRVLLTCQYVCLRGRTVVLMVPEVMDAWELMGDVERFLKAWRPMRLRSSSEQAEAQAVLAQWDRLASALGRDGRWTA
jgi:hypothetical protein